MFYMYFTLDVCKVSITTCRRIGDETFRSPSPACHPAREYVVLVGG